ncbi:MAG: flagellar FliJ family protein [Pirellulales bacterium]
MSPFKFRLTTLLTLRNAERERCRAELAAACALERQLAERRRSLEAQLERHRQWVRAGTSPGTIAVEKLKSAGQYERALRAQLAEVVADHETGAAEVGCRQQAAARAESEVRVLEKLREREIDEFKRAQALVEVKQVDEVAARTHRGPMLAG